MKIYLYCLYFAAAVKMIFVRTLIFIEISLKFPRLFTEIFRIPYAEQLEKKASETQTDLRGINKSIRKESSSLPAWMLGEYKKNFCKFTGVVPSPVENKYRNKVGIFREISGKILGKFKVCRFRLRSDWMKKMYHVLVMRLVRIFDKIWTIFSRFFRKTSTKFCFIYRSIITAILTHVILTFLTGRMADGVSKVENPSNSPVTSEVAIKVRNFYQIYIENSEKSAEYTSRPVYNKHDHTGFWRELMVRDYTTGQGESSSTTRKNNHLFKFWPNVKWGIVHMQKSRAVSRCIFFLCFFFAAEPQRCIFCAAKQWQKYANMITLWYNFNKKHVEIMKKSRS